MLRTVIAWRAPLRWRSASLAVAFGLLFTSLFTSLLVAFDHHGAEHIPTHGHVRMALDLPPVHSHAHQIAHEHSADALEPVPMLVRFDRSALAATLGHWLALVVTSAFGPGLILLGCCVSAPARRDDQTALAPPTPPPVMVIA